MRVFLLAFAIPISLVLVSCGSRKAELERLSREIQQREGLKQRSLAEYKRIDGLIGARVARNPLASAAVGALADAMERDPASTEAGVEMLLGGGYCLFNAHECSELAADIKQLGTEKRRIADEVKILDGEIAALTGKIRELEGRAW